MNALAALAAASVWGIGAAEAANVFPAACSQATMRGDVLRYAEGFAVINDCYNSNPVALERHDRAAGAHAGLRRRILAAGEMLELGPSSAELHREAGRACRRHAKTRLDHRRAGRRRRVRRAAPSKPGIRARTHKFFADSAEAGSVSGGICRARRPAAGERFARREDGAHRRSACATRSRADAGSRAAGIRRRHARGATEMLYYLFYHVLAAAISR